MKEIIKKSILKIKRAFYGFLAIAVMFIGNMTPVGVYAYNPDDPSDHSDCATILKAFCPQDGDNGQALINLFKFVINLLAAGVVIAGAVGIVICAIMWLTARDNEAQVAKAKQRLLEVVIGMIIFIMIDAIINLLLGGANWRE